MMKMKFKIASILVIVFLSGCSFRINQNFNYKKLITPEQIASDIKDLKKNLETKHYDIDWEGKKSAIFNTLDSIKMRNKSIPIGTFGLYAKKCSLN